VALPRGWIWQWVNVGVVGQQGGTERSFVASDIDPRYIASLVVPNLEVRQPDILEDVDAYDLVTARAVLHHIQSPEKGDPANGGGPQAGRRVSLHRARYATRHRRRA
jgi:hypothetical protein